MDMMEPRGTRRRELERRAGFGMRRLLTVVILLIIIALVVMAFIWLGNNTGKTNISFIEFSLPLG